MHFSYGVENHGDCLTRYYSNEKAVTENRL
jgi:hypothetical protein